MDVVLEGNEQGQLPWVPAGSQALQYSCPHGQGKCEHLPLGAAPSWALLAEESSREKLKASGDRRRRSGRNSAPSTQAPNQPCPSVAVEQPSGSQPWGSQPWGSQPSGSQPSGSQPWGSQPLKVPGKAGEEQRALCPQGASVTKAWLGTAGRGSRRAVTQVPPFAAILWQSREGLQRQELSRTLGLLCLSLL